MEFVFVALNFEVSQKLWKKNDDPFPRLKIGFIANYFGREFIS